MELSVLLHLHVETHTHARTYTQAHGKWGQLEMTVTKPVWRGLCGRQQCRWREVLEESKTHQSMEFRAIISPTEVDIVLQCHTN